MTVSHDPKPISAPRQSLPDQLRGFALLGIVLVNMPFLAVTNAGLGPWVVTSPLDGAIAFAIVALAQGKFYLLFALLFGYSLTLILRDDGRSARWAYVRRLVGLAVLGFAHAVLFFIGDILMSYAVLGFALLLFVRRSTRTILVAAAACFAVAIALLTLIVLDVGTASTSQGFVADSVALDETLAAGSFIDAAGARLATLPEALLFQAAINWFPAFAMFLLGLAAGRTTLLSDPSRHRRLWRWMLAVGGSVGLPLGMLSAWLVVFSSPDGGNGVLGVAIGFASAPALTAAYVAIIAMNTERRAAAWFEPAGRMSLTAYLGESIILSAVFCGWGLGLFGKVPIAGAAAIAVATWLMIDVFADRWLHRFRYGPAEYGLRWWSHGHRPRVRRTESVLSR